MTVRWLLCMVVLVVTGLPGQARPSETLNDDPAGAGIVLPWVLSSGMVVQRDRPLPVWGSAAPGAEVTVTFAGRTGRTTADAAGAWRVTLDALPASSDGRVMTISAGKERRVLTDVLVGEVWLCAGQSNMAWPLASSVGGDTASARVAGSPTLRLLDPQPTVGLGASVWPLEEVLALTHAVTSRVTAGGTATRRRRAGSARSVPTSGCSCSRTWTCRSG